MRQNNLYKNWSKVITIYHKIFNINTLKGYLTLKYNNKMGDIFGDRQKVSFAFKY